MEFLIIEWLGKPAWMWLGFLATVGVLLALDFCLRQLVLRVVRDVAGQGVSQMVLLVVRSGQALALPLQRCQHGFAVLARGLRLLPGVVQRLQCLRGLAVDKALQLGCGGV